MKKADKLSAFFMVVLGSFRDEYSQTGSKTVINEIQSVIRTVAESKPKRISGDHVLTGYSGNKLVCTLQQCAALFAREENCCYLEVGVFQGLTLLSVAHANSELTCFGIDNFSQFDAEGKNQKLIRARAGALGIENAHLLNFDYEDAFDNLTNLVNGRCVGTYFVDGPHDYRSQLMCLLLAVPFLHEHSVIVIDDSNYAHVRQANRDFLISHPEFKLVFEAYTPVHPLNLSEEERQEPMAGWWNGVNIIARDPNNYFPPMYPPTERDRSLFESEHVLRASMFHDKLTEMNSKVTEAVVADWNRFPRQAWRFARWMWRQRVILSGSVWPTMNTFSENLPSSNFNAPY